MLKDKDVIWRLGLIILGTSLFMLIAMKAEFFPGYSENGILFYNCTFSFLFFLGLSYFLDGIGLREIVEFFIKENFTYNSLKRVFNIF